VPRRHISLAWPPQGDFRASGVIASQARTDYLPDGVDSNGKVQFETLISSMEGVDKGYRQNRVCEWGQGR
jgi:hypothetical protein